MPIHLAPTQAIVVQVVEADIRKRAVERPQLVQIEGILGTVVYAGNSSHRERREHQHGQCPSLQADCAELGGGHFRRDSLPHIGPERARQDRWGQLGRRVPGGEEAQYLAHGLRLLHFPPTDIPRARMGVNWLDFSGYHCKHSGKSSPCRSAFRRPSRWPAVIGAHALPPVQDFPGYPMLRSFDAMISRASTVSLGSAVSAVGA